MQIIKNKSAVLAPFGFCLLTAFAFCLVGCGSPDPEPEEPRPAGAEVIDMEIVPPSNNAKEGAPPASVEESSSQSPKVDSPDSSGEDMQGNPDEESQDSPGPSLNAPKSMSMSPAAGQTSSLTSDLTKVSTVTSPAESRGDALLAIRFLSWNVESEGADADVICQQLSKLNQNDRYDIVGLTEVEPPDWKKFRSALGEHYRYEFSRSGYNDRMQILFNTKVFEQVRHFDLKEVNLLNRYRAPLVVQLKHLKTEREFLVMLNHLARGKAEIRQQQAELLVEWARDQTLPVIAIGDYNFDYVFETKKGNPAFKNMLQDNVWEWVQPEEMVDTNWYDKMGDGEDDYPGSMLDFAFVANAAKTWKKTCRVIVRKGDFPDDQSTSDHRPFELEFE